MPATTPSDAAASRFPAESAFLIKLSSDCSPAQGRWSGRIEHLLSGRQMPFASTAELLAAISAAANGTAP